MLCDFYARKGSILNYSGAHKEIFTDKVDRNGRNMVTSEPIFVENRATFTTEKCSSNYSACSDKYPEIPRKPITAVLTNMLDLISYLARSQPIFAVKIQVSQLVRPAVRFHGFLEI
jgi:hypothetical protein